METYQKFMREEYCGLKERTEKLGAFIHSDKVDSLPEGKKYLLMSQYCVMQSYLDILSMRCSLEGIL